MTVHTIQDYDRPAAAPMYSKKDMNSMDSNFTVLSLDDELGCSSSSFDQEYKAHAPHSPHSANSPARLVSGPYDDHLASHHHQPCSEADHDEPITGRFTNIERKYHIDPRVLGTGHHGSVRECIDRSTGEKFAVKSIRKSEPSVKPGGLVREIALLKEMKHRNVVRLVDVFEDREYVHLVTDLCRGGELFDRIVDKSSEDNGAPCFAEGSAARITSQVLAALSYMHENGIAHRDIKPENILFETPEDDSAVKVIDFGLSRKHCADREPPMSTVVGTPYYIAPEVLRKKYDKSCDLWSVGVIAYILLCGYPPFNGTNNDQTHRCVLRGKYYFPQEDWGNISADATDFIARMLRADPKKRMTLEQALNHPWIVKHNVVVAIGNNNAIMSKKIAIYEEEEQCHQDNSSVEVVYSEMAHKKKRPDRVPGPSGSPPRSKRKVRLSMFSM